MASIDLLLLLAAILCILQFAVVVSYRFIKGSLTGEIRANVNVVVMVNSFILVAKELNKPEFENFGIAMLAAMAVYNMLVFLLAQSGGSLPTEDCRRLNTFSELPRRHHRVAQPDAGHALDCLFVIGRGMHCIPITVL
ncbi:MAG: hypothetical protein ACO2PM_24360 [Pyrobaculum sp.]|jgi:hypothetical protein